jgi:hypothetical protein
MTENKVSELIDVNETENVKNEEKTEVKIEEKTEDEKKEEKKEEIIDVKNVENGEEVNLEEEKPKGVIGEITAKLRKGLGNRATYHNIGFFILLGVFEIFMLIIYAVFTDYDTANSKTNMTTFYQFYINISV